VFSIGAKINDIRHLKRALHTLLHYMCAYKAQQDSIFINMCALSQGKNAATKT